MAMPQAIERMIKAPWISRDVPERVCPSTISIIPLIRGTPGVR